MLNELAVGAYVVEIADKQYLKKDHRIDAFIALRAVKLGSRFI
jgi:hypothetical protein